MAEYALSANAQQRVAVIGALKQHVRTTRACMQTISESSLPDCAYVLLSPAPAL